MTLEDKILEALNKVNSRLDRLENPKTDANPNAPAEKILREVLKGKFPDEKLEGMKLDALTMAHDLVSCYKILPEPPKATPKPDATVEETKEEKAEKEDAIENPFKYATDYRNGGVHS